MSDHRRSALRLKPLPNNLEPGRFPSAQQRDRTAAVVLDGHAGHRNSFNERTYSLTFLIGIFEGPVTSSLTMSRVVTLSVELTRSQRARPMRPLVVAHRGLGSCSKLSDIHQPDRADLMAGIEPDGRWRCVDPHLCFLQRRSSGLQSRACIGSMLQPARLLAYSD